MHSIPFFSIVTPVRNGSLFIDSYLGSLFSQSFTNWEAIIVDDCSTDCTYMSLSQKTASDTRIQLINLSSVNQADFPGPWRARNIGVTHARAKYILFYDIDDIWLPTFLESYHRILCEKPQIKLLSSSYYRFNDGSDIANGRNQFPLLAPRLFISYINPFPLLSTCVSQEIFSKLAFKPCFHEDFIYWASAWKMIKTQDYFYAPCQLTLYRVRRGSVSSNRIKSALWLVNIYRSNGYPLFFVPILAVLRLGIEIVFLLSDMCMSTKLKVPSFKALH